ncbi:MAG: hypothetical protein HY840_15725 [Bacteroidetes bacterium]|nr:hypothetical protein [Bacteroidota bacterium]
MLAILVSISLFSCKQKTDYSKEISRLDSAVAVLAGAEKNLVSVDTNKLRTSFNSTKNDLQTIMEKISKDTVKKKTAMFLTSAYKQSENIINLLNNKNFIERAIHESQQRINDLKHDLNANLIEKNKSAKYLVHELNASGKIYDLATNSLEKAQSASAKLDSMQTKITFLADSLTSLPDPSERRGRKYQNENK